jgi:hypothetical protein
MLNFFENTGVSLSLDADRLKVEGLKQLPPGQSQKIREKIKTHRTEIMRELSKIPAPSPVGLGAEYERLWNEAWRLAEWIDNPKGSPIAKRRARLPKLDRMRERMAEIVRQAVPTANPEPSDGLWHPWKSSNTTTGELTLESCPARCKKTGQCYQQAYFTAKPGPFPGPECDTVSSCVWLEKNQYHK